MKFVYCKLRMIRNNWTAGNTFSSVINLLMTTSTTKAPVSASPAHQLPLRELTVNSTLISQHVLQQNRAADLMLLLLSVLRQWLALWCRWTVVVKLEAINWDRWTAWITLKQFNLLESQMVYQSKTVRYPDLTGRLNTPELFLRCLALILSISFCSLTLKPSLCHEPGKSM